MKTIMKFSVLFFCLFLFSCSSNNTGSHNSERVYNSLVEYLGTLPGVRVNGTKVFIPTEGRKSFTGGTTPLFVVEGQKIGNSLRGAMHVIDHNEIKRAKVLKSGEATVRYGTNGVNGAIEFFMKK